MRNFVQSINYVKQLFKSREFKLKRYVFVELVFVVNDIEIGVGVLSSIDLGVILVVLIDGGLLVLLVLGDQVVHVGFGLSELHLVHALTCVPMKESLPSEHS